MTYTVLSYHLGYLMTCLPKCYGTVA